MLVARPTLVAALLALACVLAAAVPGRAHEGPPFPILMEAPAGPWLVSVWTDPDVGVATFFVILEPARSGGPQPPEATVRVGVAPVSGRLAEAVHPATLQPTRHGRRYYAEIPLDHEEMWRVTAYVTGGGAEHVLAAEVEATPDGKPGPVAALVTLVPFVALGALWLKAALLRRQHRRPGSRRDSGPSRGDGAPRGPGPRSAPDPAPPGGAPRPGE